MNKFFSNEKYILNTIRYGAIIIVVFFTILIATILIKHQEQTLRNDITNIEESFISKNKIRVKNIVDNTYEYIESEKKLENERLDKRLKEQVYQAYEIATAIYNETKNEPNFSKEKIIKLIKESIRNIRFNDNMGYMFIYTMDGINILNAQFPELEGKNFWNFKDTRGTALIQEMNKILTQNDETYYEWYLRKTQEDETQYKKYGFFKKFEPLDLFIGTGDYIDEFEKDLKARLLNRLNNIKFEESEHIFVYTLDGLCLANPKKELIGTNRLDIKNEKGGYALRPVVTFIKDNKEGYIRYSSTVKLNEKLSSNDKESYVKLFEDWNWIVGSGFFIEDLDNRVNKKKLELETLSQHTIHEILIYSFLILLILIVVSYFISNIVSKTFINYRLRINKEVKKSFEKEKLMIQQSKMAIMGEMIANIAHQWKQPLNLISISSGLIKINQEEDFSTPEEINRSIENIDTSVKYLSETIDDFRNFFKPDKEKLHFHISDSINQTIKLVSSQFRNNSIELLQEIENVEIFGYQNELSQVLINLLKNAKDELVKKDNSKRRLVFIKTYKESNNLIIEIKDNADGIPEEIKNKIFDAYFTTKKDDEGTGIGLYMSKQIIEGMKGKIEVSNEEFKFENETYKGASFKIIIPL